MDLVYDLLARDLLGIPVWTYAASLGSVLLGFIGKKVSSVVFNRLIRMSGKTEFKIDDIFLSALSKPIEWSLVLGGVFLALNILPIPREPVNIERFTGALLTAVSVSLIVWFAVRLVDGICDWWGDKAVETEAKLDDQLVPIVRRSLKVFLYIIGVVLVLQNLGYSVTSLVAGLGIGGAAMALASKDTIANLFGSIVIFLDKPFQMGDWIEMGDVEGTVEDVGLRTTRVRTFANSLVTVPNALFTTSTVNNWSRMKKRRIKMTIGVTYSTEPGKLDDLVSRIRKIIENDDKIHQDFYLVNFDNFGQCSLDIFIYCFAITTNWAEYLQVKQDFMLKLMRCVLDMGLEFAFPTTSIHVESFPGEPQALSGQRPA